MHLLLEAVRGQPDHGVLIIVHDIMRIREAPARRGTFGDASNSWHAPYPTLSLSTTPTQTSAHTGACAEHTTHACRVACRMAAQRMKTLTKQQHLKASESEPRRACRLPSIASAAASRGTCMHRRSSQSAACCSLPCFSSAWATCACTAAANQIGALVH